MAEYNYTKTVNTLKLHNEIKASSFSAKYSHLNVYGTNVTVVTSSSLSYEEQDELATIIDDHTTSYPKGAVDSAILSASEFGLKLIRDFGARNVLAGKTDEEIDAIIDDNADILKIGIGLLSGSLKYTKRKVTAMTPDGVGITTDDKTWILDQLNDYLGE